MLIYHYASKGTSVVAKVLRVTLCGMQVSSHFPRPFARYDARTRVVMMWCSIAGLQKAQAVEIVPPSYGQVHAHI